MPRSTSTQMAFPQFRGAVRNLVLLTAAIYVVILLLWSFAQPTGVALFSYAALSPEGIEHLRLWQFLTYGFVHLDPLNFLFAMLGIYFLGSAVQDRIGPRAFVEMYLTSLVGAGVLGFLLSLTGGIAQGVAAGSGPAANAILMVFYLLYRETPIMLFPIPIPIPVKYIVIFTAAVEGAYLLLTHFSLFFMTQLLGMVMGYVWFRFLWRRKNLFSVVGDQASSLRNSYQRWKRRRAGKKFQVYMRQHNQDPKDYIDEAGNPGPPEDISKKNGGGPSGWVN